MTKGNVKELVVKTIYEVDTISMNNSKAWDNLISKAEEANNEGYDKVIFDFKGITLVRPWMNEKFAKFMGNETVVLRVYNSKEVSDNIEAWCILGKIGGVDRIVNINDTIKVEDTPEEKDIMRRVKELIPYMEQDENGKWNLMCNKKYGQLCGDNTVKVIERTFIKFGEENKVKDFGLNIDGLVLQSNIYQMVAEMILKMNKDGYTIDLVTNDTETKNKIQLFMCISGRKSLTINDKLDIVDRCLVPGTVGMYLKFKDTKKRDEFGRLGEGKPLYCRVAIYKGIKRSDRSAELVFRTYKCETFFTKNHCELENISYNSQQLEYEDVSVSLDCVGLYDKFIGCAGHFMAPVQYKLCDSVTMYDADEDGYIVERSMTVPERAKAVFDDWGIEYDEEALEAAIERTKEVLNLKDEEVVVA